MKWTGSRLVYMAAGLCFILGLSLTGLDSAQAGKWKRKSVKHEQACRAWCDGREDCDHCSTMRNCGTGYDTMRSWTGYGKNWHACKRKPSRKEASRKNWEDCKAFCDRNPDCKYCMSDRCGAGYRRMKAFRGRGINYFACTFRDGGIPASKMHREECTRWCSENQPLCKHCSANKGCGAGRVAMKSWTGPGRNWHACGVRSQVKAKNKADCEAWCGDRENCVKCSTKKSCGYGYLRMKSFRMGGGTADYHACKRRKSAFGTINSQ